MTDEDIMGVGGGRARLSACGCVHVNAVPEEAEKGVIPRGAGVTGGWELPYMGAEN